VSKAFYRLLTLFLSMDRTGCDCSLTCSSARAAEQPDGKRAAAAEGRSGQSRAVLEKSIKAHGGQEALGKIRRRLLQGDGQRLFGRQEDSRDFELYIKATTRCGWRLSMRTPRPQEHRSH